MLCSASHLLSGPVFVSFNLSVCRKWEGGLVEYGNYVFLDVEWFATVLDPLFSHRRDSYGDIDLGGVMVTNLASLRRLDNEHVFEPQLAEEL
ncbi:unnamed protein product, partial [Ectocarpus sp. 12 AP-2014]